MATLWARMASAMPGTSRSATSRVASGVTSRSERPEPPQVSTMSASVLSQASMSAPGDERALVHFHNAADALPTLLGNELLQLLPRLVSFQSAGIGARDDGEFDGHGFS